MAERRSARLAARMLGLGCFLLLTLALPAAAQARSADVIKAHTSLALAPDASLLVTERLTFRYEGSFEGSYRDIILKHGEQITDVTFARGGQPYRPGGNTALGSHDEPGVYGVTGIPEGVRVVWHYRAEDEEQTYTLSYRVIDAVVAWDDVIDVNWAVWGSEWDFDLESLGAELRDPALHRDNNEYRVWGHPREVDGETARRTGVATLAASDVRSGKAVEMRVTVPRVGGRDVSGARLRSGNGLADILAEERGLDDDFNSPYQRAKRFLADNVALVGGLLIAVALLLAGLLRFAAREHPVSTPEHLPEPPDDASPALAYALANEGADSEDTVLATLLDLAERGFYDTKTTSAEDEKLDLEVSKASNRPTTKLEKHELEVRDFFDELLEGDSVPLSEMKDRIPEHSETWRSRWQDMTGALNDIDDGKLAWDRDNNGKLGLLALGLFICFTLLTFAYISAEGRWFLPFAMGVVGVIAVACFYGRGMKRLTAEHRERSSRWEAFSRWTKDFPSLKDDPPATLELWKKILIFGVAFGTAERMIKSGRIPAPVLESGSSGWHGYMFSSPSSGGFMDGGSFSSGFSSQVAPESSSGGGGGGFSGGGGGASGGGGGGSW